MGSSEGKRGESMREGYVIKSAQSAASAEELRQIGQIGRAHV